MKKTRSDRKEEKTCAGNNHKSERKTTTTKKQLIKRWYFRNALFKQWMAKVLKDCSQEHTAQFLDFFLESAKTWIGELVCSCKVWMEHFFWRGEERGKVFSD